MIADLIAKLERAAETHADPEVRAACRRDARGYRRALASKAHICPDCGGSLDTGTCPAGCTTIGGPDESPRW